MNTIVKKILICFLLIGSIAPAFAQNIGFQGRKSAFYYSSYLGYRTVLYENTENKNFNIGHAFEADYTYSQTSSIGFAYRTNPSMQYDLGEMNYTDILNHRYVLEFSPSVQPTFKTNMIGIFFKFRGSKQIAPLGPYQRFGIYKINASVDYDPSAIQNSANYTVKNYINSNKKPYINSDPWGNNNDITVSSYAIGYGMGSQRVIENLFIINYGFEAILPTSLPKSFPNFDNLTAEECITNAAKLEMFRAVFFKVHVGIGILGPRSKARY